MYKLFVDNNEVKYIGDLSWSDDLETISNEISFKCLQSFEDGAKFILLNGKQEVLRGIITDKDYDKNLIFTYTGFDYGFYLNKNEVIIQFNNTNIGTAIEQLCSKVNIPVEKIAPISASVTKIYKGNSVSDIIKELLEITEQKTGARFLMRCKHGKLVIEQYRKLNNITYLLSENRNIKIEKTLSNINIKKSIQDLKNKIIITDSAEKTTYIVATAEDKQSIDKFGLLQHIETTDKDGNLSQNERAKILLKNTCKVKESITLEMLGTDEIEKGVILEFNYPEYGLKGNYYVKNSNHTINNNIHKISGEFILYD